MTNDLPQRVSELNEKARQCLENNDLPGALLFFTEALEHLTRPDQAAARAGILNNIGHAVNSLGRPEEALAAFGQAADLYAAAGDVAAYGWQLANIGSVLRDREEHAGAIKMYEQALAALTRAKNETGRADQLSNLGYSHTRAGNRDQARDCFLQALNIYERLDEERKAALVRRNLSALG